MEKYRILIVEDDEEIQEVIKQFLLVNGYIVETSLDGLAGIRKLEEHTFDLILLDVMMPYLNGFEVAKMIRQSYNVPIIMLTALETEEDQLKGFEVGIDDYITKPFSFYVLIKRVEAVLRRSHDKNKSQLSFREISIDCEAYKTYVGNNEILLTTKEFDILSLLMRHERKVLTRENIVNQVWGYDYYGETRIIDTHIKNLRKKLGIPYIRTIKGVGYKIDD